MKIILSGAFGRMGKAVTLKCQEEGIVIAAGVDIATGQASFPVYKTISEVTETADVILDFSHRSGLPALLTYAREKKLPLILCTTGYTPEDEADILAASREMPIFRSANMSIGVNVLVELVKKAAGSLAGFDIEITEMHHNQKLDAPSGTALMLLHAVQDEIPNTEPVYDRHERRVIRPENEVGMHSLRGGTVAGEHSVLFAGENEVITLSHSAQSRDVFAAGACRAALYMAGKTAPGLYTMKDCLGL